MTHDLNLGIRSAYLELMPKDLLLAKEFWPFLVQPLDKILDMFYMHVAKVPELAALLRGVDVSRVKQAQMRHWEHLFNHGPDSGYSQAATRIGTIHERIGLDPQWFNGAYCLILRELGKVIDVNVKWNAAKRESIRSAVVKIVFLDMDVICGVYNMLSMARKQEEAHKTVNLIKNCEGELSERASGIVAATEEMNSTAKAITTMVTESRTKAEAALKETEASSKKNAALLERTQQIVGIVDLIRGVAAQTNLLALNAAIEAARAGDVGRGFAVVADEVKKLAQQTSRATEDITTKVEEIQATVETVVSGANMISGHIQEINTSIETISSSMSEQNVATNDIGQNLTGLQGMLANLFQQFRSDGKEAPLAKAA